MRGLDFVVSGDPDNMSNHHLTCADACNMLLTLHGQPSSNNVFFCVLDGLLHATASAHCSHATETGATKCSQISE